jgi:Domain of unknown function (DUF4266)
VPNKNKSSPFSKNMYMTPFCKISLFAIVITTLMSGCSSITPVNAWEKADLAKPEMTFEADVLDAKFTDHIYFSREAATGGSGVGGGGCGCN